MRALAVVAVILFHCEMSGLLDAGFFGVDIFFTISGFIITAILCKEYRQSGTIAFSSFYFRRLKRLLPPVLVLLAVSWPITSLLSRDAFAWFQADLPAALSYLSNVWQIHADQSYFDTTPHVLKHLWSLAVEEQFYLLWPVPAWLLMRTLGVKATGVAACLLAIASTAWMWYLFAQNSDAADQSRLYLGTDSHAMGLLAGATLACCWNPWAPAELSTRARIGWHSAALLALALLGYMMQALNPADPAMYRGCFLLVPVLTCVILYATISDRHFVISRLLRTRVIQWLGKRSYSLYLVHWPVFVWMRLLDFKDFTDPATLATGLGLVLVLADLLYNWVEMPTTAWHPSFGRARMACASVAWTVGAAALFVVTASAWDENKAVMLAAAKADAAVAAATALAAADKLAAAEKLALANARPPLTTHEAAVAPQASDVAIDAGEKISGGEAIYAIGDSVMLGTSAYLAKTIPGIRIDAAVGRQASSGLKVVQEWVAKPHTATTVLVHLGTNGYINESQFKELIGALAEVPRVIVINVHADRRWTVPNNEIIERMRHEFTNVSVIDWHAASEQHPDYFVKDGIHLTGKGILAMTAQIKLASGGTVLPPDAAPAARIMLASADHARVDHARGARRKLAAASSPPATTPAAVPAAAAPVPAMAGTEKVADALAPTQALVEEHHDSPT
jgi:peptidoglycan/LPS O-acetylase OafA/YrhL